MDDAETGNTQFREEERHPNGTVTGSYGYVDPFGKAQIVHYIADERGYRYEKNSIDMFTELVGTSVKVSPTGL